MKSKHIKDLEIGLVGKLNWEQLREIMILKLYECESEKELLEFLKVILASMFSSVKELDKIRKQAGVELASKREKEIAKRKLRKSNKK